MPFYMIVAVGLALVSALFATQNADVITISFLSWEWEASLALVLILTLGSGMLIGYLLGWPRAVSARRQVRQGEKRIAELEESASRIEGAHETFGISEVELSDGPDDS